MFKSTYLKVFFSFVAVIFFTACSQKKEIIDSSFGISNQFEVKSSLINSSQIKLISVNGLSPITNVGEIYFLHPSRGAPSALMVELSDEIPNNIRNKGKKFGDEKFYVQKTTYPSTIKSNKDLINIKTNILNLEVLANKILADKTALYTLKESLIKAENKEPIENNITALSSQINKLTNDYKKESTTLIENMKNDGVFIFRWNTKDESKANVNVSGLVNAGIENKGASTGYVLASNVSFEKFVPTLKYLEAYEAIVNTHSATSWIKGRVGVVTYAFKAQNLVSFVSKENERLRKLEATIDNINKFSTQLKGLAKIDLNIYSLNTSLLSSSSQYSNPKVTITKKKVRDIVENETTEGGTIFTILTEGFLIRKNFFIKEDEKK